jgi:hypothetical protein
MQRQKRFVELFERDFESFLQLYVERSEADKIRYEEEFQKWREEHPEVELEVAAPKQTKSLRRKVCCLFFNFSSRL